MNKILKVIFIITACLGVFFVSLALSYLVITADAKLDQNKLLSYTNNLLIYDDNNQEIESTCLTSKRKSISVDSLSPDTINAFIASEDRTFYTHNGLNHKRMIKALYKNIVSHSFKEGASTISQQLVKNTHLSNDKTIVRKLKEIRLTKQLERKYSKKEILEMYLNTIYFGHNCYGLQSAANFYFDKKAEELDLNDSATLVGLLVSPNNYSPFKNYDKSLARRNVVLKNMVECNFISEKCFNNLKEQAITTSEQGKKSKFGNYIERIFDELEEINVDYYKIADGCKIYTYMDAELQYLIENGTYECDNAVIITNTNGGINAYKSTIGNSKRQIGSAIKPLLVYAPSIEEKLVHPFTKIEDEKINFNGYSPENYDKKYHGSVTVAQSLQQSYNIPAVKLLNNLTLSKAEMYANKMNIALENDEKNLSLALGGMKYGLNLQQLCQCYGIFQSGGFYKKTGFIKEIKDTDGKTIYKASKNVNKKTDKNRVFSEGTCSLINEMLIETSKTGTAKKLKNFNFDVATKTGTCGNEDGNTDAYAISYTSSHCIGVWLGDKENKRMKITGGNDCCVIVKNILDKLYKNDKPVNLDTQTGTVTITLDKEEYDKNNKIILADRLSPKLNNLQVKCLNNNVPYDVSTRFCSPTIKNPSIYVENDGINIVLCQTYYYDYVIKRRFGESEVVIHDGKWKEKILDNPDDGNYIYTVTPYYFYENQKYFGKTVELKKIIFQKKFGQDSSPEKNQLPDIALKDWYNQ